MAAKRRSSIPKLIETELLAKSLRRCAYCFVLDRDARAKPGQIAHVDRDPSKCELDDLAWLCLDHHDRYDSKPSQSKGYTPDELRRHRDAVYAWVEDSCPPGMVTAKRQALRSDMERWIRKLKDQRKAGEKLESDIEDQMALRADLSQYATAVSLAVAGTGEIAVSHFASRVTQWELAVQGAVMPEYRAHITGPTFDGGDPALPRLVQIVQGKLREIDETLALMSRELPPAA